MTVGDGRRTDPQCNVHLLCRHVRACQMHARFHTDEALASLDEFRRHFTRSSSRIPEEYAMRR